MSGAFASTRTTYDLILTIDQAENSPFCSNTTPVGIRGFGCLEIGQSFHGSFSVDSDMLAADGTVYGAPIYSFSLPFGDLIYSTGPSNTALSGFRGPGLGSSSPGFVVASGAVVDLKGDVHGSSDAPFVDFWGNGTFSAVDRVNTIAKGSLVVAAPVPEPETWAMVLMGILGVGMSVRPKRKLEQHSTCAAA